MSNPIRLEMLLALALAVPFTASAVRAEGPAPLIITHSHTHARLVAYDAKDRKYYSVEYAKSHGMHDRGGDLLVIIPRSKLPGDAKLSHAMHGIEP